MLQEHYINSTDLCSVDMTNKLLTLGMGSEMLYYDEEDKMYHFPLWQAQKWLREKGIEVYVLLTDDNSEYEWSIYDRNVRDNIDCNGDDSYKTYDKALATGIAAALELIKEIE